MEPESWSIERWQELYDLDQLLLECELINSGSRVIERLQRITEAAKKFRKCDYGATPFRQSLMSFLKNQASHVMDSTPPEGTAQ